MANPSQGRTFTSNLSLACWFTVQFSFYLLFVLNQCFASRRTGCPCSSALFFCPAYGMAVIHLFLRRVSLSMNALDLISS